MQILMHVSFVGLAVHTRLQEVLLGVALGAKRVGHRGRLTLRAAPHRCVHLALGGLNLQYGAARRPCGSGSGSLRSVALSTRGRGGALEEGGDANNFR